jgi:hypothetical protein
VIQRFFYKKRVNVCLKNTKYKENSEIAIDLCHELLYYVELTRIRLLPNTIVGWLGNIAIIIRFLIILNFIIVELNAFIPFFGLCALFLLLRLTQQIDEDLDRDSSFLKSVFKDKKNDES